MKARCHAYEPSETKRARIAQLWADGLNSVEIGIAVVLAESTVCRVLAEQQEERRLARTLRETA